MLDRPRERPLFRLPLVVEVLAGRARRARVRGDRLRRPGGHGQPAGQPCADRGLRRLLGRRPVPHAAVRRRLPPAQPVAGDRPRDGLAGQARGARRHARAARLPGAARPLAGRRRADRVRHLRAVLGGRARPAAAGRADADLPRDPALRDEPLRRRAVGPPRRRLRCLVRAARPPGPARPARRRAARPAASGRRRDGPGGDRRDHRPAPQRHRLDGVRRREGGAAVQRPGRRDAGRLREPRAVARAGARGVVRGRAGDLAGRRGAASGSRACRACRATGSRAASSRAASPTR